MPAWLTRVVSDYGQACAERLVGPGEPEAAIRGPIEQLLAGFGDAMSLHVVPHGESALEGLSVRPDYAVRVGGAITGYLEVKRPGTPLDPGSFRGHNKQQWERLKDLPNLIYTNGHEWRLWRAGELAYEPVEFVGELTTAGRGIAVPDAAFEQLVRDFLTWSPAPIRSVRRLVKAVAPLTRLLRAEVLDQLAREAGSIREGSPRDEQPFSGLAADWRTLLFPTGSDATFADGYAQTVTFALLLARSEDIALAGRDLHSVGDDLGLRHSLMGRALQLLTGHVSTNFRVTLDLMVRVIAAVEWPRIRASNVDAYLHLYEHFLEEYDPALRQASGSYYTPREVVDTMVRLTGDVLERKLDLPRKFASPEVITVDPAMGTGTYLHAIIGQVAEQVIAHDGPGAIPGALADLTKRLVGFELQMGPYTVAEMRAADMIRSYNASTGEDGLRFYVTNTLDDPHQEETQLASTYAPLSRSRREANRVKADTPVTVVIANPPYRERSEGQGGWIESGRPTDGERPPLEAFRAEGNGRYEYVLKNLYVYFWRWATWKVFDAHPGDQHGVVCFISTSGYVSGPGFRGMREYLRRTSTEGWVINVSPEGHRPDVATRVFPGVQQPLAIGLFYRRSGEDLQRPATIHYAEVRGRRGDKYESLALLDLDESTDWRNAREEWQAPFTPAARTSWDEYPALSDLLRTSSPGVKPNRTWVYSPSEGLLEARWRRLVGEPNLEEKEALFKRTGDRSLASTAQPLHGRRGRAPLSVEAGRMEAPVATAHRSFERQYVIPDGRLLDRARPDLWAVADLDGQLFINEQHAEPISSGPGVVLSALVPDMHMFNGRGGRAFPLFRAAGVSNLTTGLRALLAETLGTEPTPEDVAAYIAGVVSHPAYTERFADELTTPGVRVPITTDPVVWAQAVALGKDVAWAQTFGRCFADPAAGRPLGDVRFPVGDDRRITNLSPVPSDLPKEMHYATETATVQLDAGTFGPVQPRVWAYDVGGMNVLNKWFGYRKRQPGGRKSTPLDHMHVTEWPAEWTSDLIDVLSVLTRLVALEELQSSLLDAVLASELVTAERVRSFDASQQGTLL